MTNISIATGNFMQSLSSCVGERGKTEGVGGTEKLTQNYFLPLGN
jgi:hypothetical protein